MKSYYASQQFQLVPYRAPEFENESSNVAACMLLETFNDEDSYMMLSKKTLYRKVEKILPVPNFPENVHF